MSDTAKPTEGWGRPMRSQKVHYFRNGMSLCRKWGFYCAALEPDNGEGSTDDCSACARKMAAARKAGGK